MRTIHLFWLAGVLALNYEAQAVGTGSAPVLTTADSATTPPSQATRKNRLSKAQAARKSGDRMLAITLFKEVIALEPGDLETRLELTGTLAEADLFDEARAQLDFIQKIRPAWLPAYLIRGALEQRAENEISALKAFDQALAIEPTNRTAREGRLLALSRLGSSANALAEAKLFPEVDPGIIQRLHEDAAALAIRRSENVYHEYPAAALQLADKAIALIETNLKRYPGSERSRCDFVRALTNRRRYRDAIAVYEALMAEKRELPGYTHQSAAVAYLAEQQPERAKAAFKAALTADPHDFSASAGLFYALSDLTDFAAAKTHIDALAAGSQEPGNKFEAEMLATWARAYEDRLGLAQERFLEMQTRAPASTALHNALGRIYLWRGWPRRAGEEFNLAARQQPNNIEALSGLVDVAMALGDFDSAARRVAHVSTLVANDHDGLKRLKRAQELRHRPELNISAGLSRNKERSSTGRSLHLDTRIYSSPITPQNRVFAHQYFESTRFGAGSAYYQRTGLGWESVFARRGKLDLEFQHEFFKENQSSLVLGGEFQFNDFWRIRGRYDWNSMDIPLRARVSAIEGEAVFLGGGYRLNERAAIDIGAQRLSMSDSNDRRSLWASGEYQFIQGPFYKASAALDMSASTNTLLNAAYFNPRRDQALQLTLKNEWLGYRHYTRSFHQRLYVSAGSYAQAALATQMIGSVRYEHEWNFSDALNTRYGLAYVRRAFDGAATKGPEATLSMNRKF